MERRAKRRRTCSGLARAFWIEARRELGCRGSAWIRIASRSAATAGASGDATGQPATATQRSGAGVRSSARRRTRPGASSSELQRLRPSLARIVGSLGRAKGTWIVEGTGASVRSTSSTRSASDPRSRAALSSTPTTATRTNASSGRSTVGPRSATRGGTIGSTRGSLLRNRGREYDRRRRVPSTAGSPPPRRGRPTLRNHNNPRALARLDRASRNHLVDARTRRIRSLQSFRRVQGCAGGSRQARAVELPD